MKIFKTLLFLSIGTILLTSKLKAQDNPGLVLYTDDVQEGYVLLQDRNHTYLIDNCGRLVNAWWGISSVFHQKLLDNGDLMYISTFGDDIRFVTWEGIPVDTIFHPFDQPDPRTEITYEVIPMNNGNFLAIGRRWWNETRKKEYGCNCNSWVYDVVLEINRNNEVIWEWEIIDHIIQNEDPSQPNYGVPSIDIDRLDTEGINDIRDEELFMINGFDYNEELDLIVLSLRKNSEIVIIDHSTSKEEAKGGQGGNLGKGGRILYRWGNPQEYGMGDSTDQHLHLQHNPNWIEHGPFKGGIIVFDNANIDEKGEGYTQIDIIKLPFQNNQFVRDSGKLFDPPQPKWSYVDTVGDNNFYTFYTSGATVQPNGNIFVTQWWGHRLFEIDTAGTIVWEYEVPNTPFTFRTEKYTKDYPGLMGKDLTPIGYIENVPSLVSCTPTSANDINKEEICFSITYDRGTPVLNSNTSEPTGFTITNMAGHHQSIIVAPASTLKLNNLPGGLYIIHPERSKGCSYSPQKFVVPN